LHSLAHPTRKIQQKNSAGLPRENAHDHRFDRQNTAFAKVCLIGKSALTKRIILAYLAPIAVRHTTSHGERFSPSGLHAMVIFGVHRRTD
jgi:hypothetical protein